jgi:ABC-type transporter Mla MlaB component
VKVVVAATDPSAIVVVMRGPYGRAEVAALCADVQHRLASTAINLVICDVAALTDADASTIDALARLQLTVRRLGRHLVLDRASSQLAGLLAATGLGGVVPCCGPLSLEVERQAEGGEEARRVQEEGDPADPIA